MSDAYVRKESTDEVLDLYDVLPERAGTSREPASPTEDDPVTSMIKGTGRNLAAIVGMFAVSVTAFGVCTALFSLGLGLLVLVVGLFIMVGCLVVAGWSSRMTMALLSYAGIDLPRTLYPTAGPEFPRKAAAAGISAILAGSAARPDQLHSQRDHFFAGTDVGLRRTRRRDVLVLEPVVASIRHGPA